MSRWAYSVAGLGAPAKAVLCALAFMADDTGSCYPGQELLADMSGLTARTVRRALVDLEAVGLIRRERRTSRNGYRTSDLYRLDSNRTHSPLGPAELADPQPDGESARTGQIGQDSPAYRTHSPRLPDRESGESLVEPSDLQEMPIASRRMGDKHREDNH